VYPLVQITQWQIVVFFLSIYVTKNNPSINGVCFKKERQRSIRLVIGGTVRSKTKRSAIMTQNLFGTSIMSSFVKRMIEEECKQFMFHIQSDSHVQEVEVLRVLHQHY
jgi:hypothetical protein